MRMMFAATTVVCAASARSTNACQSPNPEDYVGVGTQGLVFTPATLAVPVCQKVVFVIANTASSPNITVVQSRSFEEPCTPLAGGFRSVSRGVDQPELSILVTDLNPIYFHVEAYCDQGMVFILNPAQDSDLETFIALARDTSSSAVPTQSTAIDDLPTAPSTTASAPESPQPLMLVTATPLSPDSGAWRGAWLQEDPSFPVASTSSGCASASHNISAATLGAAIIAAIAGTLSIVFLVVLLVRVRASRRAIDTHTQMVDQRHAATPSPIAGSSHTANGAIVSQFLDMSDGDDNTLGRNRGRSWVRHLRKNTLAPPPSPV